MNIIIVGCGSVGENLTEQLNENGNNITVIDADSEKVNDVSTRFDVMGVAGNGATYATQKEAGIDEADLMIAVTGSDELNLLCCTVAKRAGNHCHTIARVRNPEYSKDSSFLKDELGLAMVINPEHTAAEEIARILRFPSAIKIETFAGGRVELIKFRLPEGSPLVGMSVREMAKELRPDVLICTIERDEEAFIANGDFVFAGKDIISLIASPRNANIFFKKIGYESHSVKNVILAGGGDISHYLCEILLGEGIAVKVIEKDRQECEELCNLFPNATIIHGDAGDQQTLVEEGLENAGAFVALMEQDEENILLSLFARSAGRGKLVTKISRFDFEGVIRHLDLDAIVYPKNVTSDTIVRYARAMKNTLGSNMERLYQVIKGKVEAAEFVMQKDSPIVGIPLCEIAFKEHVLIAAILRKKKVIIPRGQDVILPDDRIVVVSELMALHSISDVLK